MGRIRTIKPEFFESETVARLSYCARLLFVSTWTRSDDEGVFRGSHRLLKSQTFPHDDDMTAKKVAKLLDELIQHGFVATYGHEGSTYGWVIKFLEHQRINRPSSKRFPRPDGELQTLTEGSLRAHGGLTEGSHLEGKGKEGERKGRDVQHARVPSSYSSLFESWFRDYPPRQQDSGRWTRGNKQSAFKIWWRLTEGEDPELVGLMTKRLESYIAMSVEYPPDAVRWLKDRRWEDEEADSVSGSSGIQRLIEQAEADEADARGRA